MRPDARKKTGVRPYVVLAVGILAVSSSVILITFARREGVPAIAIAALRLTFASVLLAPVAALRSRQEWARMSRRDLGLATLSGILLAFHFAFWISSLDHTSVISSMVLVSTNPFFVGLLSMVLFRESVGKGTLLGIGLAVTGGVLIALTDLGQGGEGTLQGDALALAGAATVSGYLLIGRGLRRHLSLIAYISLVYSTAAVVLLALALALGASLGGYSPSAYALILMLALGPQLVGHSAYNWALKYVSATFVTVTVLAEPIGATLLSIPILGQRPSPLGLMAAGLILAGIYLAAREESQKTVSETADAAVEL